MALPNIGATLVSARSFDEYVAMFGLDAADLGRSILDCPGGAASFCAEARDRALDVMAVDPVYATDITSLGKHAVDEAIRGNRHTASSLESFVWTFFSDINDHRERRVGSAQRFGRHLGSQSGAYVAGALPRLPFRDNSFDLVLSSHLLFLYADRLDEQFHHDAARELIRVARHEVRIFPLVSDQGADTEQLLGSVCRRLSDDGVHCEIRPSTYEFQRGANKIFVLKPMPERRERPAPAASAL
jgi:SAM-dependent methyltransferase